jgi:hypothetical protein
MAIMRNLTVTLIRINPSWPGLSRPSTSLLKKKDVDARHKAGHDGGEAFARRSSKGRHQ